MTPTERQRLHGPDLARFVAFAGMVIVNFHIVMGAEADTGPLSSFVNFLGGKAAATFVVLAGLGLGLAAGAGRSSFALTARRAAFLLVVGLVNMTVFDADILHYYAFYFLFAGLVIGWSTRWLIAAMAALSLAFVVMLLALDYDKGWNWDTYTYSGFWTVDGFVRNLFFNGWHPVAPWLAFALYGIVLSRLDLASRRVAWRLTLVGLATVVAVSVLSAWLMAVVAQSDAEAANLFTTSPIPPMPLYVIAGMGSAAFVIGACLLITASPVITGALSPLIAAGRQTLTLYIAHILIGMGALEALGLIEERSTAESVIASGTFCALAVTYAWLCKRWFKRGPAEAAMRAVAG